MVLLKKSIEGVFTCRELLKLFATTGVSLATATILLFTGKKSTASTSEKSGSIRLSPNLSGPDDQLDPPLFYSAIDYTRGRATDNSLVHCNEDLATRPELNWLSQLNQIAMQMSGLSSCVKESCYTTVHRFPQVFSSATCIDY